MTKQKVVIVGGGFAGLAAALELKDSDYQVTLLDRRNFNLFQPLLYQVATASLTEADIAMPLRFSLSENKNTSVYRATVSDFDVNTQMVITDVGDFKYDKLIVCSGVTHNYFGHDNWAQYAPGLKTVEDALDIRNRILLAFENAELELDPEKRKILLRFVIIGSGPTGVELAGSLGELAHSTLKSEFRNFTSHDVEIILIEGSNRVLAAYPEELSKKAVTQLKHLRVSVMHNTRVTDIQDGYVKVLADNKEEVIYSPTIIWAAGMKATNLANQIAKQTKATQDRQGRVSVNTDLSIPDFPNIFVLGDIANIIDKDGNSLPGIAPVAMQQGHYIGKLLKKYAKNESYKKFTYLDKGNMAVIGKNRAVAQMGRLKFSGYIAWLLWVIVHIWYLIGYDSKLLIMIRWAWTYWTSKRGARLIIHSKVDEK